MGWASPEYLFASAEPSRCVCQTALSLPMFSRSICFSGDQFWLSRLPPTLSQFWAGGATRSCAENAGAAATPATPETPETPETPRFSEAADVPAGEVCCGAACARDRRSKTVAKHSAKPPPTRSQRSIELSPQFVLMA